MIVLRKRLIELNCQTFVLSENRTHDFRCTSHLYLRNLFSKIAITFFIKLNLPCVSSSKPRRVNKLKLILLSVVLVYSLLFASLSLSDFALPVHQNVLLMLKIQPSENNVYFSNPRTLVSHQLFNSFNVILKSLKFT